MPEPLPHSFPPHYIVRKRLPPSNMDMKSQVEGYQQEDSQKYEVVLLPVIRASLSNRTTILTEENNVV
ncbi:unnamed protein product [Rhizopus stolonifer]